MKRDAALAGPAYAIYIYVCVYLYIYIYIYTSIYVYIYVYILIYIYIFIYVYKCISTTLNVCIYMYLPRVPSEKPVHSFLPRASVLLCTSKCTYIYSDVYKDYHVLVNYMYAYIHIRSQLYIKTLPRFSLIVCMRT